MPRRSPFSLLNRDNNLPWFLGLSKETRIFGQQRIIHLTSVLLVVLFCAPIAANATGAMVTSIEYIPESKVAIQACTIYSLDNLDARIHPRVTLVSYSNQPIIGVHIALTFYKHDPIDGNIDLGPPMMLAWPIHGDTVLGVGQSAEYNDIGVWILNTQYPSNDFVSCSIDAVKFEDGTVWRASAKGR